MQQLLDERIERGARVSREAARPAREAQQLPGPVDVEREPVDLVQPGEGPDAAAGVDSVPALEPARRRGHAAARRQQAAGLGPVRDPRSVAALRARLRSGDATLQVRGQPALRRDEPAVQRVPRAGDAHGAVRFDVGPTRERQLLTQLLDRGRTLPGQKMPEPMLRAMYGQGGGIQNPLATILRQQDSLHLTAKQADSIATLNRWYTIRNDSIWAPVAKYLGTLPDRYDEGAAYDRYMQRASRDGRPAHEDRARGQRAADAPSSGGSCRRSSRAISSRATSRRFARARRRSSAACSRAWAAPVTIGGGGHVFVGGGGGGAHE